MFSTVRLRVHRDRRYFCQRYPNCFHRRLNITEYSSLNAELNKKTINWQAMIAVKVSGSQHVRPHPYNYIKNFFFRHFHIYLILLQYAIQL